MVRLDPLAALGAAPVAVALHPVVEQVAAAFGLLRLDVGGDAGGGRMLHAALVHRVLAHCRGKENITNNSLSIFMISREWIS